MKTFLYITLVSLAIGVCGIAFADTVTAEVGVPITVTNDTYTVAPPDYYYYTGHRCYTKERPEIGASFLGLKASVGGSEQIYCYPYP